MEIKCTITWCLYPKHSSLGDGYQYRIYKVKTSTGHSLVIKGQCSHFDNGELVLVNGELDDKGALKFVSASRYDAGSDGAISMMSFCFGPKQGQKIIHKAYDDDAETCWDEFKNHPDLFIAKASKIRGIGTKKLDKAFAKYEDNALLDVMSSRYLPYGLSVNAMLKAVKKWGASAIRKIDENPYILTQFSTFETADAIGRKYYKLPDTHPYRIEAGVLQELYGMLKSSGDNYAYVNKPVNGTSLLASASRKLSLDPALISDKIVDLETNGKLVLDWMQGERIVYTPVLFKAENTIASILKRLNRPLPVEKSRVTNKIADLEAAHGFALAAKQKEAIETSCISQISLISGPPGSGKTTIIDFVCQVMKDIQPGLKIQLCAPTGKAANRMSESTGLTALTIHRLLRYNPAKGGFEHGLHNPLNADLLIVDEFSMVDTELCAALLEAVGPNCKVIFVGDKDQLPSVGSGKVLDDILHIPEIPTTVLDKVYRQGNDSTILDHALSVSRRQHLDLLETKDFTFYDMDDKETPQDFEDVVDLYLDEVKDFGLDEVLLLSPMNKGSFGTKALNSAIQDVINPLDGDNFVKVGRNSTFRLRDRVIQLVNEADLGVFNGMVGTVVGVDHGDKLEGTPETITVDFRDFEVEYTKDRYSNLGLAYALTVHKCQGSEAKSVILLCHTSQKWMMQPNLIYTGMTRAKKKLQMCGCETMLDLSRTMKVRQRLSKIDFRYHSL